MKVLHPLKAVVFTTAPAEPLKIRGLNPIHTCIDRALSKLRLNAPFRRRYPHQLSGG